MFKKSEVSMKPTVRLKQSNKATQGFTLIELVVVIVILGILAATAAPKFIDLTADARTSTLEGVEASVKGASALIYSKAIVKGVQNLPFSSLTLSDDPDGTNPFYISYGYPVVLSSSTDASTYWKRIIDVGNDFIIISNTGGKLIIYPNDITAPTGSSDPCIVTYSNATGEYSKPTIAVKDCV